MKYITLIYDEEKKLAAMSKAESDAFMGEYFGYTEAMKKAGVYLMGEALHSVDQAKSVRMREATALETDGPSAETKE